MLKNHFVTAAEAAGDIDDSIKRTWLLLVAGDFNVLGDVNGLDSRVADMFARYTLSQHVSFPTHRDGNVLDLIHTRDDDTPCGKCISDLATQSVCFSDHHLVTSRFGVPSPPSPVTTSFV